MATCYPIDGQHYPIVTQCLTINAQQYHLVSAFISCIIYVMKK